MINFLIYYFAELASAGSDFLNTKDMKKDMKKVLQQLKNVSIENFVDIDNLKDRMLKLENFVGRNIPSAANDIPIKVLNTDEEILLCETKIEKLTKILTSEQKKLNDLFNSLPDLERIEKKQITVLYGYSETGEKLVEKGIFEKIYMIEDERYSKEEINELNDITKKNVEIFYYRIKK